MHDERHLSHLFEADLGRRIEVDAQLVGVVEVRTPRRPRVEVDDAEVDRPDDMRGVARDELGRAAATRETHGRGLEPLGSVLGNPLLEEELLVDAVDEALHRRRALGEVAAGSFGDVDVIGREVELGEARLREVHLARAREANLAPRGFDRRRFLGHPWMFSSRASRRTRDSVRCVASETMTYEAAGRVARITLDRPERGNAITLEMPHELSACVERANLDPEIHVIALSGNGSGFCGGYDLVESAEGMGGGASADPAAPGTRSGGGGRERQWFRAHRSTPRSSLPTTIPTPPGIPSSTFR